MKIDDSFTKPGSVPFKWEIRPGVPKLQNFQKPQHDHYDNSQNIRKDQTPLDIHTNLSPQTSPKLKPPPAAFSFQPRPEIETPSHSFRSAPHTPSRRFAKQVIARGPDIVSSGRCFLSPLWRRKRVKKRENPLVRLEPEYSSDVETSSRWSVSSRRSVSPMSYSFPSDQSSSPYQVSDVEWAALTLF